MSGSGPPRAPRGLAAWRGSTSAAQRGTIGLVLLAVLGAALIAVLEFRGFLADRSSAGERARLFAARDTDDAAARIDGELEAFAATRPS